MLDDINYILRNDVARDACKLGHYFITREGGRHPKSIKRHGMKKGYAKEPLGPMKERARRAMIAVGRPIQKRRTFPMTKREKEKGE